MAVYTQVDDEELIAFLSTYDLGGLLSCKGIAEGVENSNYYLHTGAGSYILTLYEKRVAEADLPFFLSLDGASFRARRHLPSACEEPRRRSSRSSRRSAGRDRHLSRRLRHPSPGVSHCAALGAALAKLHIAGAGFPARRVNSLSVLGWRKLFAPAAARADEVAPNLRQTIADELEYLEARWPNDLPSGVIHADLFPDNVFFLGDRISGLIDFYFACTDAFAYDLAICLNAWCFEANGAYDPAKGRALLENYRNLRPLERSEIEAFPLLARGAALRFLLTRFVDWLNVPAGALVRPKDPREYLSKLLFHQHIGAAQDYGLSP